MAGAAGLLLAGAPAAGTAADSPPPKGKAKSVIQIWAAGGPTHLDTFDPKPDAGNDYCGPLNKPIATNVDGIRISELLPMLAKQADKYSIIRSMTHGNNGHETASYLTQTGRRPGDRLVYPCAGAVVSLFKGYDAGYKGLIPPYVVLTQTQGRFSEAGFLGPRCQPFATGGDPAQQRFMVEGVSSQGVTDQQQQDRRDLLRKLDTLGATAKGNPALTAFYESEEQAYDMILGDGAKAFDLSQEKPELRSRYGHPPWSETALLRFGQACLAARRLVERGVPYITINHGGWDTHTDNFRAMQQKLPELDQGLATLLEDLADRGLLDTTVVWWCGEFGRTPKIDWQAALERRTQPLRQSLFRRGRRRRLQGRTRGRLVGCEGRRGQGSPRLSVRPARQYLRVAGDRPRRPAAQSAGPGLDRDPDRRGRHPDGGTAEGDHVNDGRAQPRAQSKNSKLAVNRRTCEAVSPQF